MKLKARITMEAEITESEAKILLEAANRETESTATLKRMVELILKKSFPNAGYDSYIPGCWLEEISDKLKSFASCDDLEIPKGDDNNGRI